MYSFGFFPTYPLRLVLNGKNTSKLGKNENPLANYVVIQLCIRNVGLVHYNLFIAPQCGAENLLSE